MNYQELKTALKTLQDQGHTIPSLNSKKEVLQNALTQILATIEPEIIEIVEVSIEPTPAVTIEIITTTEPLETLPAIESKESTTSPSALPIYINPEHPAVTEFKSIAKRVEIALIWGIALVRSLIRFATPRIKTAIGIALRFTIFTAALLGYWLLPKMQLVAYSLGIWGMSIALKIIRNNRGWSIA